MAIGDLNHAGGIQPDRVKSDRLLARERCLDQREAEFSAILARSALTGTKGLRDLEAELDDVAGDQSPIDLETTHAVSLVDDIGDVDSIGLQAQSIGFSKSLR